MAQFKASITYPTKQETREIIKDVITDLTRQELAKKAKALFSTVNKRIARLQTSDVISPALNALEKKRIPKFTIGGKNLKELQKEYSEALAFYNLETGTVTGARVYTNQLKQYFGDKVKDKNFIAKTFDLLRTLKDRLPELYKNVYGKDLQTIIQEDTNLQEKLYSENSIESEQAMTELIDKIIEQTTEQTQDQVEDLVQKYIDIAEGTFLF